jgi:hypothetical protein
MAEDRTTLAAALNPATIALDIDLNIDDIAGIVDMNAVRMIDPMPRIELVNTFPVCVTATVRNLNIL